jgi:hypothetical protein
VVTAFHPPPSLDAKKEMRKMAAVLRLVIIGITVVWAVIAVLT